MTQRILASATEQQLAMAARPLVASRLSSLRDSAGAALRGRVELNLYFGEARIEGYNISSAAHADDAAGYVIIEAP